MRRRTRIRTKILAALALPVVALAAIALLEVTDGVRQASDVREQARLAKAASGPNGLLTALQNERNRAAVDLLGQGANLELPVRDNAEARERTNEAIDELAALIAEQGGQAEELFAPAIEQLDQLTQLRTDVDAEPGPFDLDNTDASDPVFIRYTELIDALLDANTRLSVEIEDPELRRGADLAYRSSLQTDLMARLVRTLLISGVTGGLDNAALNEAGGTFQLASENYAAIRDMAVGEYATLAERLVEDEEEAGLLHRVAPETLASGQVVDLQALLGSVSVSPDEGFYGFREGVREVLDTQADDLIAGAERRALLFPGLAVAVVAVAGLATWLVSRSITRPLRALTRQATEMANHRLPDAVLDILD
ncbi:MAG: nitrate- and nitrite sensing domain-containing protein, partial [Acidimicrobiales bacterium]